MKRLQDIEKSIAICGVELANMVVNKASLKELRRKADDIATYLKQYLGNKPSATPSLRLVSDKEGWMRFITEDIRYLVDILVYDTGSKYGIDGGKISKLSIEDRLTRKWVVNYDRGWDINVPDNERVKPLYGEIIKAYNYE